jgi:hypothetical protein
VSLVCQLLLRRVGFDVYEMRVFGCWLLSVGGLGQDSHQNGSRLPIRVVYCESAAGILGAIQPIKHMFDPQLGVRLVGAAYADW